MLTPDLLLQLQTAVEIHQNIPISGATGTGKATPPNALSRLSQVPVMRDGHEFPRKNKGGQL